MSNMLFRDVAFQDDNVDVADIRVLRLQQWCFKKAGGCTSDIPEAPTANEETVWEIASNDIECRWIRRLKPGRILHADFDGGIRVVVKCCHGVGNNEWLIERISRREERRRGHANAHLVNEVFRAHEHDIRSIWLVRSSRTRRFPTCTKQGTGILKP